MTSKKTVSYVNARFIDELVRGINHDMGAPVRHIVYFAQRLSEQMNGTPVDEKHQRWLNMIHDSGKQMHGMLSSLALLSRLSTHAAETKQLNLRAIFDKSMDIYREHYVTDDRPLTIRITGTWPTIIGCEEHWRTLFSSLIENACKFQPNDNKRTITINAHCRHTNSELMFSLDDNGIGTSASQHVDITRPFKRLNRIEDYSGIGMGLTYCDYIAELNNGILEFSDSELGGLRVTYRQHIESVTGHNIERISKG